MTKRWQVIRVGPIMEDLGLDFSQWSVTDGKRYGFPIERDVDDSSDDLAPFDKGEYRANELADLLNALEAAAEALEPAKEMIATLSAHIPDTWPEDRPRAGALTMQLSAALDRLRELRDA